MGIVAPPASAGIVAPHRAASCSIIAVVIALLALGWGSSSSSRLPFGGIDTAVSIFWGFLLVCIVLGVLAFRGRRKQREAREKAIAQRAG